MKVTVVVCTYSKSSLNNVIDCIHSLKRQKLKPVEIILALDKDKNLVEFYRERVSGQVNIVVSDGFGLSRARNIGVRNATGEIIAFIDDDAVADERWLENLVKNYDDTSVLGVGGAIKPQWEDKKPFWFPEELLWVVGCSYKGLPERKTAIRNLIGCNMSFRRKAFDIVGYFRIDMGRVGSRLTGHEDTEFSIRLSMIVPDGRVIYDPDAIVYHRVPRSRANMTFLARRSFAEGYSKAVFSNNEVAPPGVLKVEKSYLKQLLLESIPQRLLKGYRSESLSQIVTLLLSTWMVLFGYFSGYRPARARGFRIGGTKI